MTEINYMTQGNVQMPRLNTEAVQQWIVEVAQSHGQRVGCLTYVFCDDEYILATNREFLGHDYYTDTELMRVIIHGVLHLCGINDKGPGEREFMEKHENDALAILPKNVFIA